MQQPPSAPPPTITTQVVAIPVAVSAAVTQVPPQPPDRSSSVVGGGGGAQLIATSVHLSSSHQLQHQQTSSSSSSSVHVSSKEAGGKGGGGGQEGRFRIIKTDKALPVNNSAEGGGQQPANMAATLGGLLNGVGGTHTNLVALNGGGPPTMISGSSNGLSFAQVVNGGVATNPNNPSTSASSASTTKYQKGRWHVVDIEFPNAPLTSQATNQTNQTNNNNNNPNSTQPIFTLGSTSTDALDQTSSSIKEPMPSSSSETTTTTSPTSTLTDSVDSGIHSRINMAMDLVKTHLTSAVKEEIVHLELQIKQLNEKCSRLEQENVLLRKHVPAETLSLIESRLSNLTIAIE